MEETSILLAQVTGKSIPSYGSVPQKLNSDITDSKCQEEMWRAMYAFDIFDTDKNGIIDQEEFTQLVNYPDLQSNNKKKLTNEEIKEVLDSIAISHDDKITKQQFYEWYANGGRESAQLKNNTPNLTRQYSQLDIIRKNIGSSSFLENFQRLGMRPTYYCFLCQEYQPIQDGINSICISYCYHRFCIECLREYLINCVNNGMISPTCFYLSDSNESCNVKFDESDIVQLLPEESKKKYYKFKANQENKNNRQCPNCDHTQLGDPSQLNMKCNKCKIQYCFMHANAHPGLSCAVYERNNYQEEKKSEKAIKRNCKPCPECGAMIGKNGGCNHMKCSQCQCSFCWLCMQQIEDVPLPDHYKLTAGNITNPCVGRQMEGEDAFRTFMSGGNLTGCHLICFLVFIFVLGFFFLFVVCPISLSLTAALCIFCLYCNYEELLQLFTLIASILCMIFSCIFCIPCVFGCMVIGNCFPYPVDEWEENQDNDAV